MQRICPAAERRKGSLDRINKINRIQRQGIFDRRNMKYMRLRDGYEHHLPFCSFPLMSFMFLLSKPVPLRSIL
jgi:hypothetical protein